MDSIMLQCNNGCNGEVSLTKFPDHKINCSDNSKIVKCPCCNRDTIKSQINKDYDSYVLLLKEKEKEMEAAEMELFINELIQEKINTEDKLKCLQVKYDELINKNDNLGKYIQFI